jgi:hypothetical protein
VFRDVTYRRETQRALANSEARYRENRREKPPTSSPCRTTTAKSPFISPSIRKFGFEPAELLGKTFTPHTHPDDAGQLWKS